VGLQKGVIFEGQKGVFGALKGWGFLFWEKGGFPPPFPRGGFGAPQNSPRDKMDFPRGGGPPFVFWKGCGKGVISLRGGGL